MTAVTQSDVPPSINVRTIMSDKGRYLEESLLWAFDPKSGRRKRSRKRILWILVGLMPGMLFATSILKWWNRSLSKK
jgi:hypothetical protein